MCAIVSGLPFVQSERTSSSAKASSILEIGNSHVGGATATMETNIFDWSTADVHLECRPALHGMADLFRIRIDMAHVGQFSERMRLTDVVNNIY